MSETDKESLINLIKECYHIPVDDVDLPYFPLYYILLAKRFHEDLDWRIIRLIVLKYSGKLFFSEMEGLLEKVLLIVQREHPDMPRSEIKKIIDFKIKKKWKDFIEKKELNFSSLAVILNEDPSIVEDHVKNLRKMGILETRKNQISDKRAIEVSSNFISLLKDPDVRKEMEKMPDIHVIDFFLDVDITNEIKKISKVR